MLWPRIRRPIDNEVGRQRYPTRPQKERQRTQAYLRTDGERASPIRTIVTGSRYFLPKIEADLGLVKELVQAYERTKAK